LIATGIPAAWKCLREAVRIDLVFVEVKLKEQNGFDFIKRLRNDCFFKPLPVVVYTSMEDHSQAKWAFSLKVQSYLIKPYSDTAIHAEIAKACANPWRDRHFEEERSFCAQMGLKPEGLKRMLQELGTALDQSRVFFLNCADGRHGPEALTRITELSEQAQAAGFWGAVDYLQALQNSAEAGDWLAFKQCDEDLTYATRLIHCRLNPNYVPEALLSGQEREQKEKEKERAVWLVDVLRTGPVLTADQVQQQVDALPGFPVVDTVAAAFQMSADGRTQTLTHLMDLVYKDPGLAVQMLIAANHLERDETTPVDDPRVATSLLGSLRLHSMAQTLPLVSERDMNLPPITWARFCMFQLGVARLASYTCRFFEFASQAPYAYVAGLVHDIGKLLLLRLHPFGFHVIVGHARQAAIPLHEAERRYLGCTSREIAYHFASKNGLPSPYCNVIRWVETPDAATEDTDLVAVVSLARDLCLHNHVGYCGDTPKDQCPPIVETAAWAVLQHRVFTGFNLAQFEQEVHTFCTGLRQELLGHQQ
jgi:CheY-like chemotaxis protein/HD-like signal output (HDOD) protein